MVDTHWVQMYTCCHVPGRALWTTKGQIPGSCPNALSGQWRTRQGHTYTTARQGDERCRSSRTSSAWRLRLTCVRSDELALCGSKRKGGKVQGEERTYTRSRFGTGAAPLGSKEKLKAAETQVLSTEGGGKEAGPRTEGLSRAKSGQPGAPKGFLKKRAGEVHLRPGKTGGTGV